MTAALVIENARTETGKTIALLLRDGMIAAIGPDVAAGADIARFDAEGALLLPPLVDGHIHLDKTLIGLPFIPHIPGETVARRIEAEKQLRRTVALPVTKRGGALLEKIAALGTLAVRSHVDIDTEIGLANLEAVLSLKQSHGHLADIQTVAFPQSGVLRDPGTADLLDAAISAGADLVGGLDPAGIDNDVTGHLDAIFGVAGKHGVGLDIHLHDGGALGAFELRQIAERTVALGLEGKVNVSHAFCLGELSDGDFGRTSDALAGAGVSIMTSAPGSVPMPPVKRLAAAGVRLFCASDNIRDAWSPFGNGDMLERVGMLCDRQDFRSDDDLVEALLLATSAPSAILGLPLALEVGAPADFILVPAASVAEAVAARPLDRMVFRHGAIIARGGRLVAA